MNARARQGDFAEASDNRTPSLAWKPERAARELDISLTTFRELVKEGRMPKPIPIPGHPGLALFDAKAVGEAWSEIVAATFRGKDPWDDVK